MCPSPQHFPALPSALMGSTRSHFPELFFWAFLATLTLLQSSVWVRDKLVGCYGLPGKLSIRSSPMEVWADLDREFILMDASDLIDSHKTQLCLWTNLLVTSSQERIAKYERMAMQCSSDQRDLAASWRWGWHVCIAVSTWGGIDEASRLWAASFLSSSVFCSFSHSRSHTVIIPISHVDK